MPESVRIEVDGESLEVTLGVSLAAALLNSGRAGLRSSVTGQPRSALCGMGICFECRVSVDGHDHQRACMIACRAGMRVETGRG